MIWMYIRKILGSGLHWDKSQEQFRAAVERAEQDGQAEAAEHIRIIWEMRNRVMMEPMLSDKEKDPGTRPG